MAEKKSPAAELFDAFASQVVADTVAVAAANVQAKHYNALIYAGLIGEDALAIANATSKALFEMVGEITGALASNAKQIAEAIKMLDDR